MFIALVPFTHPRADSVQTIGTEANQFNTIDQKNFTQNVVLCSFQVTDEMVNDLLEGLTLQQAVQQNRLFIIDHKIVGGLPVVKPEYEVSTL